MSERYEVRKRLDGTLWVVLIDESGEVFFSDCDRHEENAERIAAALNAQAGVVEALTESLEAMDRHAAMYPHMDKGFMVDARSKARAALAAVKERDRG